jgi:hypothetical protein
VINRARSNRANTTLRAPSSNPTNGSVNPWITGGAINAARHPADTGRSNNPANRNTASISRPPSAAVVP